MKRLLGILGAGIFLSLLALSPASAQNVNTFCSSTATPPYIWTPCSGSGGGGGTVNQGTAAAITGGWPVIDGAGTDTTGTLTSGAGTVNASIDGYASIKVQIKGTYAGFTFTTNASSDGGTTFVPIQCALVDGSQFGTSFTLTANQSTELACGHQSGDDTFQIATAAGPASGTANLDFSPAAFPSDDGQTVAVGKTVNAIGITPTDHTIASASGSSQQIMAANTARHSLTIENTGNANCGVNPTGGTAVIGGAGTITIAPLGAYTPRVPPLSAITIICTSGQPIYGDDN